MNKDNIDKLVEHFISQIELTETDIKKTGRNNKNLKETP